MARHYATRDFFRQMPNPLLARYFHARGVFDDLDIAALPEPQPDALWAAWLTLDDPQRHTMDAAFQESHRGRSYASAHRARPAGPPQPLAGTIRPSPAEIDTYRSKCKGKDSQR